MQCGISISDKKYKKPASSGKGSNGEQDSSGKFDYGQIYGQYGQGSGNPKDSDYYSNSDYTNSGYGKGGWRSGRRGHRRRKNKSRVGWRIIGGKLATEDQFPWQVTLNTYGQHFCGGSIITNKCVLTAAHCLEHSYKITVRAGTLDRYNERGKSYNVVKRIFHPKWNTKTSYADLMVVCVNPHITYQESIRAGMSGIGPVCLPPQGFSYHGTAKISGFGKASVNGEPTNQMFYITEKILSHRTCHRLYGKSEYPYDRKTMICAGKINGRTGTCQGDSGGPLVVLKNNHWYQYGIVSYGGDVCGKSPTVFTKVSAFSNWILEACNSCK
ncbi:Transmembrane protease serine 2-like protein [Leptotrombidium deliense]|uniref:Transmembrane protease serine 2-like protein n=1 Tax=Leptotrombidium deliense TaxID=299467 RepID=A0A443SFB7_9ACAR|nr:Transmembrane protease serine 2-like protein [Leptotrombidium deliense]